MEKLLKDWREFIELLNSHEARYLIAGGYAVLPLDLRSPQP